MENNWAQNSISHLSQYNCRYIKLPFKNNNRYGNDFVCSDVQLISITKPIHWVSRGFSEKNIDLDSYIINKKYHKKKYLTY